MIKIKITYILILLTIINIASAIKEVINLKLTGFLYEVVNDNLYILKEKFNQYAAEHNLGIYLDTYFYTYKNSTSENVSFILKDLIIQKEKNENDLFLIDTICSSEYAEHFEDLTKYLPKSTISLYKIEERGVAAATGVNNGRLVSLPLFVDYGGLYYNDILLNKYNKTVPSTWDELIETFNEISKKEAAIGNVINKYVALPDGESSVAHTLEFIHSFRDDKNDQFPEYTSRQAIKALEKMKEIKDKISDNDTFSMAQRELFKSIHKDHKEYLFFRYWYFGDMKLPAARGLKEVSYKFAPLPGNKTGISGSCIGGLNMALNRYISEEKKKAAAEVYNFFFSYDFQKFLTISLNKRSAIHDLYSDNEICTKINCPMYSNLQGIVRPTNNNNNYHEFSSKVNTYMKEYIYENKGTADETLIKIDDIQRIHFVEYTSISGVIIMFLIVISILSIIASYIYISIKRTRTQFNFLPFSYWCYFLLGLFLLICSCLTGIGDFKEYNCVLRPILISIGFTLSYMPFFIKMMSIYKNRNMIISFINNNNQLVLVLSVLVDMVINFIWILFDPIRVQKENIQDGASFKVCKPSQKFGLTMIIILLLKSVLLIACMGYLVITEWNVVIFKSDIRHIGNAVYFSITNIVIYVVVIFVHIDSRYLYNGIRSGIAIVFCLSNLILILGPKIYKISFYKDKVNNRKNINRFIEKTGVFNDNYQNQLNFIDIEDIVDTNLIRQNKYGNANRNNYQSSNRRMNFNYGNFGTYNREDTDALMNTYSNFTRGDPMLFTDTINSFQKNVGISSIKTPYMPTDDNNNPYNYSNQYQYPKNINMNYNNYW